MPNLSAYEALGENYDEFWWFRGRYRVVKGSRGSKKSKSTAIWYITHLQQLKGANLLVVRQTYRSLKDSCFTELRWAINRLGQSDKWKITESPLEMTFKRTGQKIYFRGLDDSMKITSITVENGVLCWCWIEEAFQIRNEADFDTINEGIRGTVPDGLFKQMTLTFNPWHQSHWLKKRFFDAEPSSDLMAITKTYLMNEFLDDSDRKEFEDMKIRNPRRYVVAGLGEWGITDGLVYENFEVKEFSVGEIQSRYKVESVFGLDFGYTNDESALFCGLADIDNKQLYVFNEMYAKGMSNERLHEEITKLGYSKEVITADSAEPKSIDRIRGLGIRRIKPAVKGKDSIMNGIDYIQDYKIIIHPKCVNFITEIEMYTWAEDRAGQKVNKPVDDHNHLMDAMRYAMERYSIQQEQANIFVF